MIINQANLTRVFTGFQAAFNRGIGQAPSTFERVSLTVPSTTKEEKYGWLGKFPGFRQWVGDRVVQNVMLHDYSIKNLPFENTIGVDRDDLEDDTVGIYAPMFQELGETTVAHPNQLVYQALKDGFASLAYDGQFFFDTDHPVLDANGVPASVANTDGGAGTAWFLIDASRALKPIIWQRRKPYNLVRMDRETDENVFMRKEFLYGVDARVNVGYGLWQMAWGSKQTLDKANYKIARVALQEMKGDFDRPIGIQPNLLVVPPSLEFEALEILNSERDAAGATNVYKGTAEHISVPWLA